MRSSTPSAGGRWTWYRLETLAANLTSQAHNMLFKGKLAHKPHSPCSWMEEFRGRTRGSEWERDWHKKVAMLIGCVDHMGGGGLWSVDLEVPAPFPGQC